MKRRNIQAPKIISLVIALLIIVAIAILFSTKQHRTHENESDEVSVATPTPAKPEEIAKTPTDLNAFPGTLLIADRGNNRLLELTSDKKIVWQLNFNDLYPGLKPGLGADDAFFTPGQKTIIVNLEEYHVLAEIDYQTKKVIWQYGSPGHPGHADGFLNTPDDAYRLANGITSVADIKNCRVIFINQAKQIVKQFGVTNVCKSKPGFYNEPNGDTPLLNGDTLISIIRGHQLTEVRPDGSEVNRITLPIIYPSDAQKLKDGNYLVADYTSHGSIIEITPQGKVVWSYFFPHDPQRNLNKPSLAIQLPNGNIIANDDANQRVIVIDYNTKEIIWQYGVTGKAGSEYGQLNTPDGLDLHGIELRTLE